MSVFEAEDMRSRPVWLFDLDGTLIDSSTAVVRAFHVAQSDFGEPPAAADVIRSRIGYPLRETVAMLTRIEFAAFLAAFRREAMRSMHEDTVLLDGVPELLATLKQQGRTCAVVTSKGRENALHLLTHLGVAAHFATVVGEDCTPHTKPHPAPIREAQKRLSTGSESVVMVGDTRNDIESAQACGVPIIALASGYDAPEWLADADLVLDHPRQLHRWLRGQSV